MFSKTIMTIYMETGTKFHAICWTRASGNNLYKGQDGKYKGPYTVTITQFYSCSMKVAVDNA